MEVLLYGCGKIAQSVLDSIADYVKIVGAYDNNHEKAFDFCGNNNLKVIDDISSTNVKNEFVLVTTNKYYDEISEELVLSGVRREKIINVSELNTILVDKIHSQRICNVCTNKVFDWMYVGDKNAGTERIKIIGGGYRRGGCPVCGCNDRERFVYDYINNRLCVEEKSILHFAPEIKMREYLLNNSSKYIGADLCPGRADVIEDIRNLSFKNNQFDVIICNHVLEHVDDDRKALLELYRCLSTNGIAIITVPICWETNTIENDCVNSDEARIELYGQADHVRLYGKDFEERLKTAGFNVKCIRCQDADKANYHGFINGDAIFICSKTEI